MKLTRWWFWPLIGVLNAAYIMLGFAEDTNGRLISDAYDVAIVALPCSAALFILTYTALGFLGAAKWWRTDFGNRLVLFPYAIFVATATLAWAQLFHHGLLNTPLASWIYLGGIVQAPVVLLWGIPLWVRAFRDGNGHDDGKSATTDRRNHDRA